MDEVDGMAGNEDRGGIQVMKDCISVVVLLIFRFLKKFEELIIITAIKTCC